MSVNLKELGRYVDFDEADVRHLVEVGPILLPHLPALAEGFYNKIREDSEANKVFSDDAQLQRLRETLQGWARRLFSGIYDDAYAGDRARIGEVHVRLGVQQKHVIGSMNYVRHFLLQAINREVADLARASAYKHAVNKILDIDLNLMCESYFESSVRELRTLNRRLEEANLELAELSRVKDDFLAHTSHELRTPLNSILGFTRLILDGYCQSSDEEHELMRDVYESAQHLLDIVNDILDVARIEVGKLKLTLEPVELRPLLDQVLAVVNVQAEAKNLKLVDETREMDLPPIFADAHRVRQILINLLGNAIKFTDEGWITLRSLPDRVPGNLYFEVQDTGVGIPPEMQAKLFEKFTQVDTSFTRQHGGSGLGLTICRHLVEMMGGKIGLISRGDGTGTTVHFTLPLAAEVEDRPHRADLETLPVEGPRDGTRILVVDNDAYFRKFLRDLLVAEGYAVLTAAGYADGLDAAERFRPALAVVDWALPVSTSRIHGDGIDLIATLDSRFSLPSVLVTGHDPDAARKQLERMTVSTPTPILHKPVSREQILSTLRQLNGEKAATG